MGAESGHDDGGGQNIRIKSGDRLTVDSAVAQQELIVTLSVIPNLLVLVLTHPEHSAGISCRPVRSPNALEMTVKVALALALVRDDSAVLGVGCSTRASGTYKEFGQRPS